MSTPIDNENDVIDEEDYNLDGVEVVDETEGVG